LQCCRIEISQPVGYILANEVRLSIDQDGWNVSTFELWNTVGVTACPGAAFFSSAVPADAPSPSVCCARSDFGVDMITYGKSYFDGDKTTVRKYL
jgi:hypothetical protein